jgi:hypothetical protein
MKDDGARTKDTAAKDIARFFQDLQSRADFKAFDRIMKRRGGESPRSGDELPE